MTSSSPRLAAVVVLHHPAPSLAGNIASYQSLVNPLILVDNTPGAAVLSAEIEHLPQVMMIRNSRNFGLAKALNQGAEMALQAGCDWLLTMDQDSRFEGGALAAMMETMAGLPDAGILSPRHVSTAKDRGGGKTGLERVRTVFTSGNLLCLAAYQKAGPFREDFFIDYIDHEYCLRLRRLGFWVYRMNSALLFHGLGAIEERRFLFWTLRPTHHAPERRYYMTRNRLAVMRQYPEMIFPDLWAWAKEVCKLVFFETDKRQKLQAMWKGMTDYFRGQYGPLISPT